MIGYLLRRTALFLGTAVLALVAVFVLLRVLPGDPADALGPDADADQIAAARAQLGSDQPLGVHFATWLGRTLRFDLGESFVDGSAILPAIGQRLTVTLPLTLISFVLAVVLASLIGYLVAAHADSWPGRLLTAVARAGVAVPVFWIGLVLVLTVGLRWRVLPAGGFPRDGWADPLAALRNLVLPVTTLVVVIGSSLVRHVRATTLDVLDSHHVRHARALGSRRWEAFARHGFRNASALMISVLGVELGATLVGALVVESVFALPGLGTMLSAAVAQHDVPALEGVLLVTTFLVLIVGFLADLARRLVDPRLRASLSEPEA